MVTNQQRLDRTFAALADTTRRSILSQLAQGDATVGELAEPFPVSRPAISKHLRVLERAGLFGRTREGRVSRCALDATAVSPAATLLLQAVGGIRTGVEPVAPGSVIVCQTQGA